MSKLCGVHALSATSPLFTKSCVHVVPLLETSSVAVTQLGMSVLSQRWNSSRVESCSVRSNGPAVT